MLNLYYSGTVAAIFGITAHIRASMGNKLLRGNRTCVEHMWYFIMRTDEETMEMFKSTVFNRVWTADNGR